MSLVVPILGPLAPAMRSPLDGGGLPWESGGAGAPFTPATLGSMLTLWLDERGQVGSPIDTWNSQCAGYGAQTAAGAFRPATGRTINGYAAPDFDGTGMRMTGGGPISTLVGVTKMYFLAVVQLDAIVGSGADYYTNECLFCDQGNNVWMGFRNNAGALTAGFGIFAAGLVKQVQDTVVTGSTVAIQGWHDGTNVNVRVGAGATLSAACGSINSTVSGLRLGSNGGSTVFMNGAIATLIGCNDSPSAAQIAQLRAYVTAKYGCAT